MENLQQQINELRQQIDSLKSSTTIPFEIGEAIRLRMNLPLQLTSAPISAVTSPTGGATVDTPARTAIDSIITQLETLGLINPN